MIDLLKHYIGANLRVWDTVRKKSKLMNLGEGSSSNWIGIKALIRHLSVDETKRPPFIVYKPIMLPLSAIDQVMIFKGYNDGKPFKAIDALSNWLYNNSDGAFDHPDNARHWILGSLQDGIQRLPFELVMQFVELGFWIGDQSIFGEQILDKREFK